MNKKPQSRPGKIKGIIVTPKDLKEAEQESLIRIHSLKELKNVAHIPESSFHLLLDEHKSNCMDKQVVPKKKKTISDYLTIKMPFWIILLTITVAFIGLIFVINNNPTTTPTPTTNVQKEIVWELTDKDSSTFMQQDGEKAKKIVTFYYEEK